MPAVRLADHRRRDPRIRARVRRLRRCQARGRAQLVHRRAAPRARGGRASARRARARADDDVRGDGRGRSLLRCGAGVRRLRSGDAVHRRRRGRAHDRALMRGEPVAGLQPPYGRVRAIIPMHYAGQMADVDAVRALATRLRARCDRGCRAHAARVHALRIRARRGARSARPADITCFSFYANKCITTGEGGMAVTDDEALADRMRLMSLHGMSKDAWKRYTAAGSWYYEIVAPGLQVQPDRHRRRDRPRPARAGRRALADAPQRRRGTTAAGARGHRRDRATARACRSPALVAPVLDPPRSRRLAQRPRCVHRWAARSAGSRVSVHWMPLHMHPYYRQTYGIAPERVPGRGVRCGRALSRCRCFPG